MAKKGLSMQAAEAAVRKLQGTGLPEAARLVQEWSRDAKGPDSMLWAIPLRWPHWRRGHHARPKMGRPRIENLTVGCSTDCQI
jgi:hypothetical protein